MATLTHALPFSKHTAHAPATSDADDFSLTRLGHQVGRLVWKVALLGLTSFVVISLWFGGICLAAQSITEQSGSSSFLGAHTESTVPVASWRELNRLIHIMAPLQSSPNQTVELQELLQSIQERRADDMLTGQPSQASHPVLPSPHTPAY